MTQTSALVWKECRELRWFLWVGLAIFLGAPLLDLIVNLGHGQFHSDSGEGIVLSLGGVLAVFLATAVTARDLHGPLETFWRSRTIGTTRLVLVKYATGLAVLLLVTLGTLLFQQTTYGIEAMPGRGFLAGFFSSPFVYSVILVHTFALILLYSVAFLIGCLVRQAAQSAILSVAGGLLIYFLPMLVRPLAWLSVFSIMFDMTNHRRDWSAYGLFVVGMVAGSAVALAAAWLAVKREWRVRADQRVIYWTLGGVVIVLLAVGSFQLRSNMNLELELPLASVMDTNGLIRASQIKIEDGRGVMLVDRDISRQIQTSICPVHVGASSIVVREPLELPGRLVQAWGPEFGPQMSWSAQEPSHAYVLQANESEDKVNVAVSGASTREPEGVRLITVRLGEESGAKIAHVLELPVLDGQGGIRMSRMGDQLFLMKHSYPRCQLLTVGIADPDRPELDDSREIAAIYFDRPEHEWGEPSASELLLRLLPVEGLSPEERLRVSYELSAHGPSSTLDGKTLVHAGRQGLTLYQVTRLDDAAVFEQVGQYRALPLDRVLRVWVSSVVSANGIAYVIEEGFGGTVTAYDISDPARPRRIGHYAATDQRFADVAALPGRRALLAGSGLSLVSLP